MNGLLQDLRYAFRMLRRSPGLTAVILIMLTLGIGAYASVFTIFEAILLRPLSLEKPQALVHLWATRTEGAFQQFPLSYPNYLDIKQRAKSYSSIGGYSRNSVSLSGKDGAEQIPVAVATSDFFETLGVRPFLGRTFDESDDHKEKNIPVLLTYGAWQRRFAGDPNIPGKPLVIDGEPAQVAGVLPQNFQFAPGRSAELWISARLHGWPMRRNAYWLFPVGRLKPGVTIQQAQAELSAITGTLAKEYPDANVGVGTRIVDLREEIVGPMQRVLIAIMAAIGFVLLITCANGAGLLLARSLPRRREIAVRIALGAKPLRIARQLLTESMLLSLIGGMAGIVVAYRAVPVLIGVLPQTILLATPPLQGLTVSPSVLWFALSLSLATGLLFGLAPVLQTFKPSLQHDLQEGGRGAISSASRVRNLLVVSEMALAVVLLVGAGLMLKSLGRLLSANYFSTMSIPLRSGRFFNSQDTPSSAHVVIVNQALVDLVFHGQDPIGKRLNSTYTNEPNYVTIVGVVANENVTSLDAPVSPIIYDCYDQNPNNYFSVVLRTKNDPDQIAPTLTRAVHQLEPEAAIYQTSAMAQLISTSPSMMMRAYPAYLIGGFSVLALLLAALGLYGLLAYNVAQRTRELGVRMALGAEQKDLLRMVVKNGLELAAVGIVGGLLVARFIASLLFGVASTNVWTFMTVGVVLLVAAFVASYVPALRATRVDPMVALRYE